MYVKHLLLLAVFFEQTNGYGSFILCIVNLNMIKEDTTQVDYALTN